MEKTTVRKDLDQKTITIERSFAAPKEKIWRFYTEKELFEQWWGPEGWETIAKEFNFSPGGRIHYCMKCVDENQGEWFGQESWGLAEIVTVDAPNAYSANDYFSNPEGTIDEKMPGVTYTFEMKEENGNTLIITTCFVKTVEQLEQLIQMGMAQGFDSQLNKLERLVQE